MASNEIDHNRVIESLHRDPEEVFTVDFVQESGLAEIDRTVALNHAFSWSPKLREELKLINDDLRPVFAGKLFHVIGLVQYNSGWRTAGRENAPDSVNPKRIQDVASFEGITIRQMAISSDTEAPYLAYEFNNIEIKDRVVSNFGVPVLAIGRMVVKELQE